MAEEAAAKGKVEEQPSWWPQKPSSAPDTKGQSLLSVHRPGSQQRPSSKQMRKGRGEDDVMKSIDELGMESSSNESDYTDDERLNNASPQQKRASILIKKNTRRM